MSGVLSWFSKPSKSHLPEPTALQALRAKQIEQLRTFDASVSELQRDVEYRVIVSDVLALYIMLPPNFPQERPVVRVMPPAMHAWIDGQMIVSGCSSLNAFMVHSNLGKVVREIVDEFRKNPPIMLTNSGTAGALSTGWPTSVSLPSATYSSTSHHLSTISSSQRPFSHNKHIHDAVVFPTIDSAGLATVMPLHDLLDLSVSELKELHGSDEKLTLLLRPKLAELQTQHRGLITDIETLATENIAKKTVMEDKKRLLLEKYDLLNDVRRKFDEQVRRQDELRQKYDLGTIQDNLKVAALQAEEKTENIAEQFLNGSISVEEFNKSYMSERTLCHLRHAKEEKLCQSMRQRPRPF